MASEDTDVKIAKKSETKEEKDQEAKKITTKDMLHEALRDLKSRKGTSLYAIKKYIEEKYKVDVEKLNYIIKKSLKSSVEAGTIIQTKGIGASGSFRLAPGKDLPAKKKKPKTKKSVEKPTVKKSATKEKVKKTQSTEKDDTAKEKTKDDIAKPAAKKEKTKKESNKTMKKEVTTKKTKTAKMAEEIARTPAKKKSAMMKRKSIGSIIKPPKMNPKKG